jgi:hypothetical protein
LIWVQLGLHLLFDLLRSPSNFSWL